jgi:hypothetical protein
VCLGFCVGKDGIRREVGCVNVANDVRGDQDIELGCWRRLIRGRRQRAAVAL